MWDIELKDRYVTLRTDTTENMIFLQHLKADNKEEWSLSRVGPFCEKQVLNKSMASERNGSPIKKAINVHYIKITRHML